MQSERMERADTLRLITSGNKTEGFNFSIGSSGRQMVNDLIRYFSYDESFVKGKNTISQDESKALSEIQRKILSTLL